MTILMLTVTIRRPATSASPGHNDDEGGGGDDNKNVDNISNSNVVIGIVIINHQEAHDIGQALQDKLEMQVARARA